MDHRAHIFQNLNGAKDEVTLALLENETYAYNYIYNTRAAVYHGNGPSKVKNISCVAALQLLFLCIFVHLIAIRNESVTISACATVVVFSLSVCVYLLITTLEPEAIIIPQLVDTISFMLKMCRFFCLVKKGKKIFYVTHVNTSFH